MTALINTFQERFGEWTLALLQHLQISLLSLLLAILIAIPLAILLANRKGLAEIVLQLSGIGQTIPSLALLGLFIPFMGIGILPAVTALVIYAIFPILQNTITGIRQVDPILKEAGEAFGMTWWERLKTFELALAMPVIVSGIRTSAVMIIGTATLAALIGAGGLGSFILLGIDRNNTALIVIGAFSSAILALVFNFLLKRFEKGSLRKMAIGLATLILALGLSYSPNWLNTLGGKDETIVIAGKLGAEPDILINMYQLLIENETDLSVEIKPNFGKTSFLYQALMSGDIDIYPEFTGTITSSLLTNPPASSTDAEQVYKDARDGIKDQDNLILLEPMAYQNTYAVVVPSSLAQSQDLKTISDLAKVQDQVTAGFTLEFNDREDGNKGLTSRYGLSLNVVTMEPSLRYQAIANGEIQVTDAYSTDPEITKYELTILEDDKQLFPPYQGAPLLSAKVLAEHPELEDILNQLGGKISEKEMSAMNYQVAIEGKSAHQVAKTYLKSIGLLP